MPWSSEVRNCQTVDLHALPPFQEDSIGGLIRCPFCLSHEYNLIVEAQPEREVKEMSGKKGNVIKGCLVLQE